MFLLSIVEEVTDFVIIIMTFHIVLFKHHIFPAICKSFVEFVC